MKIRYKGNRFTRHSTRVRRHHNNANTTRASSMNSFIANRLTINQNHNGCTRSRHRLYAGRQANTNNRRNFSQKGLTQRVP